ncbi:MAG: molybdopterin-guanine dinucleotide biosynthesis protein A, partial [Pseudomonadota bacterium]
AEKMIIVALRDGYIDTLYRGRGLLAQMTAIARATPIFEQHGVEDYFTFFDFARLMGFRQLTISDGKTYAHQVTFE